VSAELPDFMNSKNLNSLEGVSAKEQVKLAREFVDKIAKTDNEYIKGFNSTVGKGPAAVARWYATKGQHITLKSTGALAKYGGKAVKGIKKIPGVKYAVAGAVYSLSLENSAAVGRPGWQAHPIALIDTASPVGGPGDNTATWDMTHKELTQTNVNHPSDLMNPFSPRFIPTQAVRSLYGSILGSDYMK